MKYENGTLGSMTRSRVAWKWPARSADSLTRLLDRNRYAALVFAQS